MFEVDTLKYATLATVSRCGMVWFANDVVTQECPDRLSYLSSFQEVIFIFLIGISLALPLVNCEYSVVLVLLLLQSLYLRFHGCRVVILMVGRCAAVATLL